MGYATFWYEIPDTNGSNGFIVITPGYFLSMLATMVGVPRPALPYDLETIHRCQQLTSFLPICDLMAVKR